MRWMILFVALALILGVSVFIMGCKEEPAPNPPIQTPPVTPPPTTPPEQTPPPFQTPPVTPPPTTPPQETSTVKPVIPPTTIPGGYMKQSNLSDPKLVAEANQAMLLLQKEHSDWQLVKIHEAATQVVAGMNYFFRLEIKAKDSTMLYDVIMYVPLGKTPERMITKQGLVQ